MSPAVITPLSLPDAGSQTVSPIPLGSVCSVSENTGSLQIPANACAGQSTPAWSTIITSTPVTIGSSPTTVTVQNTLECKPINPQHGYLLVSKIIKNNTGANLTGMTFAAIATCGSTPNSLILAVGGPKVVHNVPVGVTCTVVETLPAPPTTGCQTGVPTWGPIVYTPPSVVMISGAGPTITVTNTLDCKQAPKLLISSSECDPRTTVKRGAVCACRHPSMVRTSNSACGCSEGMTFTPGKGCARPIECRAPLRANAAGTACICSPGLVRRGNSCERPIECRSPAKQNRAGTSCVCPKNMELRGNSCVERERRQPTVTPRDVIRGIPGLPGGGIRRPDGPGRGSPTFDGPRRGGDSPGGAGPGGAGRR